MTLKVYGTPMSRAGRTLWMCRELGIDFEHDPLHFADERLHSEGYHAVNPNERVPAIEDGDLRLFESMAINLYLARKHESELYPRTLEDEARAWQWSFWVMTEIEKPLLGVLLSRAKFPEGSKEAAYFAERYRADPEEIAQQIEALQRPLQVLDDALADRDYLLGESFSVADLNVASILVWARMGELDLTSYPHVDAWLGRCLSRPSFAS